LIAPGSSSGEDSELGHDVPKYIVATLL
jgi:hypothetical protein